MEIIHIVLGKANPDRMNGVNKVVFQMATEQHAAGVNVTLWGITADTEHNYGERNFKTVLFPKSKNPFWISKPLRQAIKELNSNNAIVHLHGGWIPQFWMLSKLIAKTKCKMVLTPHGAYNQVAMATSKFVKKFYFQVFEKPTLQNVSTIHCIGESEKTGLQEIYKNQKQVVLPYGFILPKLQSDTSNSTPNFVVGFMGRIDIHTKGLDLLIKAFTKFSIGKNCRLWFVGDGGEINTLKSLISTANLTDKTVFHGSKFGEDKFKLLNQMDVFIHASRNEGLPSGVLEACSQKTPVIVTNATNVGSYVAKFKSGLVIHNNNADELEEALTKMHTKWTDKNLDDLGENAYQMVEKEFSWSYLVQQFNNKVYKY